VIFAFYFDDIIKMIGKLLLRKPKEKPGDEESTPGYENNSDTGSDVSFPLAGDYALNSTSVGLGIMRNRGPGH